MDPSKGSSQLTAAGDVPSLESVHAVVLYDPGDGRVRHIHHVFVFKGGRRFELSTVEKDAFVQAEALGHQVSLLKTLHVPDFRYLGGTYRVDAEKRVLVRVPGSTQLSRAGHLD